MREDGRRDGGSTFEDDAEGALADFLAYAVVDADDVVGAGWMRGHYLRYVLVLERKLALPGEAEPVQPTR